MERICKDCGQVFCNTKNADGIVVKINTPGSVFIEIILWLCFFIPGIIYSIWRLSARYQSCPNCGSKAIIPSSSPKGRELKNHLSRSSLNDCLNS